MKRTYRNYSDDDVRRYASEVVSMNALLGKLGLVKAGGNYDSMRGILQRLNVDTSHWKGQAWSKEKQFKNWSSYTRVSHIKPHLIRLRGHACERCALEEWLGELIPLEVHHVDGDRTHNEPDNLQLLCPNCHAKTHNYRGKK